MYKVAVLGDRESVLGFKALGFDTIPAESTDDARASLKKLAAGDYAVIYITEQLASNLTAEI
ncbi:MAG: V-type ATP synthase subunit F, partial [Clostridia bacterium]